MTHGLTKMLSIQLVRTVDEMNNHALSVADGLPPPEAPYMIASTTI